MMTTSSAVVRPKPHPNAARTLICLSFCGGGTASMRPWAAAVAPDTELVLICYPGREGRYASPFATTWDALQSDVLNAVSGLLHRPFTLLGHSMGGWVAFDLAARLAAGGLPAPSKLVVSASEAPTGWMRKKAREPRHTDSDESLLHWMSTVGQLSDFVLGDPDLRQMALEVLRADIAVSDDYRFVPGTRLDVPIQVLHGAQDGDLDTAAVDGWRELTTGPCRVDRLPGGHFYTPELWSALPTRLVDFATMAIGNHNKN